MIVKNTLTEFNLFFNCIRARLLHVMMMMMMMMHSR